MLLVFGTEFKLVNEYDTTAKEITWTMKKVSMYDSCQFTDQKLYGL